MPGNAYSTGWGLTRQSRIDALAADRGLLRAAVLVDLVRRGLLDAPAPPSMRLADIVRRHVIESFHANQENVSRTARALGISRVSLRRHLQAYGVKQKGGNAGASKRRP